VTWLLLLKKLPWGRIAKLAAVVGLLVVVIGGPCYFVWTTRDTIADLETDLRNERSLREAAEARLKLRQTALEKCNTSATTAAAERDQFKANLEAELAKPDRVVVRYREVPSPPEIIHSTDCTEGVSQFVQFARALEAAERGTP
jgi:hypothetical protein